MLSVVYLLRSPLSTLSHALFSEEGSVVVLSLEDPFLPGKVERAPDEFGLKAGDTVSYDKLVEILLNTKQVVTL